MGGGNKGAALKKSSTVMKRSSSKKGASSSAGGASSSSTSSSSSSAAVAGGGDSVSLEVSAFAPPPPVKKKRGPRKKKLERHSSDWHHTADASEKALATIQHYNKNSRRLPGTVISAKCFPNDRTAAEFVAQEYFSKMKGVDDGKKTYIKLLPEQWKEVKMYFDRESARSVESVAHEVRSTLVEINAKNATYAARAVAVRPFLHRHAKALRARFGQSGSNFLKDFLGEEDGEEMQDSNNIGEEDELLPKSSTSSTGGGGVGEQVANSGDQGVGSSDEVLLGADPMEGVVSTSAEGGALPSDEVGPAATSSEVAGEAVGGQKDTDDVFAEDQPLPSATSSTSNSQGLAENAAKTSGDSDDEGLNYCPAGDVPADVDSDDDLLNYKPPGSTACKFEDLSRALSGDNVAQAAADDDSVPLNLTEVGSSVSGLISLFQKADKNTHDTELLKAITSVVAAGFDCFLSGDARRTAYEKLQAAATKMLAARYESLQLDGTAFCEKFLAFLPVLAPHLGEAHAFTAQHMKAGSVTFPVDQIDRMTCLIQFAEIPAYKKLKKGLEARQKCAQLERSAHDVIVSADTLALEGLEDAAGVAAQQTKELEELLAQARDVGLEEELFEVIALRLGAVGELELDSFHKKCVALREVKDSTSKIGFAITVNDARKELARSLSLTLQTPCTAYQLGRELAKVAPVELRWELRRVEKQAKELEEASKRILMDAANEGGPTPVFNDWVEGGPYDTCKTTMQNYDRVAWSTRQSRYQLGERSEDSNFRPFYVWRMQRYTKNKLNKEKVSPYLSKLVELRPHLEADNIARDTSSKFLEKLAGMQMLMKPEQHTAYLAALKAVEEAKQGILDLNERQKERLAGLRSFVAGA
ncbi:unnamed protein product [Amoebophrya sp. A25]|nr:unnamed protein product [Amoebophrya sp. A25]|eukprot:GSA25T00017699001.1